ncbi:tRNA pseudouridine(38-40) synthase TruA [Desulfobacter latus]|uniref:tRNA pseudouridine synthase A n=1 Tax=Desulfobacter latus TaxID=2292 RepID=A0A850SYP4_9BACT|nr:tRNA pseudouridine(38-40) synthase TruA [Desulfobacter latus]NWH04553.1 tRNA pseudouridine(38-40) synthase TruA [Desulfobacter latus]
MTNIPYAPANNFKIVVAYDGTGFFGWQRQTDKPTIQGELERILSMILNQDIKIHGSGRTDAGVHARAQVAHFHAKTRLTPDIIQKGVNSLMSAPIVIHNCRLADPDFHAQYHARSKEYRYYILNREIPTAIGRDYVWHVKPFLDIDAMNLCCESLVGEHDFKAFENTGSPRSSTVRTIFSARWTKKPYDRLEFCICATGFLKNMVRNIVGTLKDAGTGRISPEMFNTILYSGERPLAGATAPAKGLFLHNVNY